MTNLKERRFPALITLLTDFGTQDGYAGTMKGVILNINPEAKIVDISHSVPAGDVKAAAFVLLSSYAYFPSGTIHMCVVDPEVGSGRRILIIESDKYLFVAPDNGLVDPVLEREPGSRVFCVDNPEKYLEVVSNTFHGRDIFSPVTANLSLGAPITEFAKPVDYSLTSLFPLPSVKKGSVKGEIIYQDSFGNLISNICREHLEKAGIGSDAIVSIKSVTLKGIRDHYSSVPEGFPLALFSSTGFLEIVCYRSSAAERLSAGVKTGVEILKREKS